MLSSVTVLLAMIGVRYAAYFGVAYAAYYQFHYVPVCLAGFSCGLLSDCVTRALDADLALFFHPRIRWFLAANDEHFILASIPIVLGANAFAYFFTVRMCLGLTTASAVAVAGLTTSILEIVATLIAPGRDPARSL